MQGYLSLVLHAHLPFVRHPEYDKFLEENWLFRLRRERFRSRRTGRLHEHYVMHLADAVHIIAVTPGQDLVGVLRAAGVSADGAARLAAAEVAEETDLTLRPAAELAKNNPALLAKIIQVLREAMTPAEQQEALTAVAAGRLKKGFLERATQYVASEEELFHLLEVIRPQFALARVTFTGDLDKVYRQCHLPKETPPDAASAPRTG